MHSAGDASRAILFSSSFCLFWGFYPLVFGCYFLIDRSSLLMLSSRCWLLAQANPRLKTHPRKIFWMVTDAAAIIVA